MLISKVSLFFNNKINKSTNNASNPVQSAQVEKNTNQNIKSVSTKDILYSYPLNISFGSSKDVKNNTSFEKSVEKFFRLSPDKYQLEAAKHIFDGSDSLVLAPTGTGKTLIAEYAINKNLADGKRTFYTTPLKALSNEKYTDFCKLYGKENVGLLTGDIKINRNAPIVLMTTEIYRNMVTGNNQHDLKDELKDVATVIYDEFHYMNDEDRGEVWETSIMYTPQEVQQLLLSATADNGEVIQKWMNRLLSEKDSSRIAEIVNVPSRERHVPLKYFVYDNKRSKNTIYPLVNQNFNLKKLEKAMNPNSKLTLSDKQSEVLADIAFVKTGVKNPQEGINVLKNIVNEKGSIQELEDALVLKLGLKELDAKRTAAILADNADSSFNEKLKENDGTKTAKDLKAEKYKNKISKIISKDKIENAKLTETVNRDTKRALVQLSRKMTGKTTLQDGFACLEQLAGSEKITKRAFEQKLQGLGFNGEQIEALTVPFVAYETVSESPQVLDLINVLEKEDKLPAIFFNFSKKQCNNLRNEFLKTGRSLLNDEEKQKASEIINKHIEKGDFLGTGENPATLLSGVAVHNSGKMPSYKALVEELAQNKLLKVVFATSTLGAGINVPARTVVFTQLTRYSSSAAEKESGSKFVTLTPSEFQQMAGRAGRRGKDSIGNVVVIPDREHSPSSIYNLVISKPDAINSNFKPTYSFISHLITTDGTDKYLEDAVDKSFLKDRLESVGLKPYKVMKGIKSDFNKMSKVLLSPELKCFEEKDGFYTPTIKGEIVSKARGVNGLLFAEALFNSGLEYLTPQELAVVACSFIEPDDKDNMTSVHLPESINDVLWGIDKLNEKIQKVEDAQGLNIKDTVLNRVDAQYISQWANAEETPDMDSRRLWEKIIKSNTTPDSKFNEGDFLKSVNRTVDILEQFREVSSFAAREAIVRDGDKLLAEKMSKISKIADESLKLMKRDPVQYDL